MSSPPMNSGMNLSPVGSSVGWCRSDMFLPSAGCGVVRSVRRDEVCQELEVLGGIARAVVRRGVGEAGLGHAPPRVRRALEGTADPDREGVPTARQAQPAVDAVLDDLGEAE